MSRINSVWRCISSDSQKWDLGNAGETGGLFDFTDPNVWRDIGFLGSNGEKLLVSDRGSTGPSWVRHCSRSSLILSRLRV